MFVIDTNKEAIAIPEARKLNIPVVAILDSNSDPDGISHPVPGQRRRRARHQLYCDLIARAAIDGIERAKARPASILALPRRRASLRLDEEGEGEAVAARPKPRDACAERRAQGPAAEARAQRSRGPGGGNARPHSGGPHASRRQRRKPQSRPRTTKARRCAAPLGRQVRQRRRHGEYHGDDGEGPAREDRRGHDGLQGGARRDQGRHGGRGRLAAHQGPGQGGQEGRPRRGRRPDGLATDAKEAALVEVNSETDFVARNETFQKMAAAIAQAALKAKGDLDKLAQAKYAGRQDDCGRDPQRDDRHHRREHDAAARPPISPPRRARWRAMCTT